MTLNEYQAAAMKTCTDTSRRLDYMVLGLASEASEVAGKLKKKIRDGEFDEKAMAKEVGDVLWYVAGAAEMLGYTLEDIARINLHKLRNRAENGTIAGSGDNR